MSLASVLLEGAPIMGMMSNDEMSKYNYDDGYITIYHESTFELVDVFRSCFYEPEQVALMAAHEGTSVQESYEYREIMENVITDAFDRLKAWLKSLWTKVKAFIANIVSKFNIMHKDDAKFVQDFNDKLNGKLNLSGFKYNMYTYTNIDEFENHLQSNVDKTMDTFDSLTDSKLKSGESSIEAQNDLGNMLTKAKETFIKNVTGASDVNDASDALYAYFRSGARPGSNKPEISVSSLDNYLSVLKSAKNAKDMDKYAKDIDNKFNNAMNAIKKAQKDNKSDNTIVVLLKKHCSAINELMLKTNSFITTWRTVTSERSSAYRSLCNAALAYSKRAN